MRGRRGGGTKPVIPADSKRESKFVELKSLFETLHGPDGCPWDRKQTHRSLLPKLREEVREFAAAVQKGDIRNMQEELGDILLLVMFNSMIAAKAGNFTIEDVIAELCKKLKRRHPHVFGAVRVKSANQAIRQYHKVKDQERHH